MKVGTKGVKVHLRKLSHDGCHIVLCKWRGEYVTWVETALGNYILGRYFQNYDDAFAAFRARR